MKNAGFGWWLALCAVSLLAGALLSAAGWLPYPTVKALVDGLSPDGNFKILTPAAFGELLLPLRAGGILLLLAAALGLIFRKAVTRFLGGLNPALRALPAETRRLAEVFRPGTAEGPYLAGLLVITLGGVLARLLFITEPMGHDEAYTYIAFAARPWWDLLSDYHLPNNHIFHTILVKLATELFGMAPWAVRLPALVSGVLCVPAVYWLGKRLYGRSAGLLAAGLLAALPMWIDYNTNARGYSQVALFSVLLFGLAIYLSEHKNHAGWLAFSALGALGLFTLPPMLYPFGMALVWLVITALVEGGKAYGGRGKLVIYAAVFAGLAIFLAALCYLPVVMGSGLKSLVGNPFVVRYDMAAFLGRLDERVMDTWGEWRRDLPGWVQVVLWLGFSVGLVFHKKIARVQIAPQLATFAWLAAVLLLQRPDPNARLWTFLIPFWLVWCAGGLLGGLALLHVPSRWRSVLLVVGLVALAAFSWQRTLRYFPSLAPGQGNVETAALYLQPRLEPGDGVVITSDDGPALWYYLRLHGVDDRYYVQQLDERTLQRAFILVNESQGQTLESAAELRKLPGVVFDFIHAQRMTSIGGTTVYLCEVEYNR